MRLFIPVLLLAAVAIPLFAQDTISIQPASHVPGDFLLATTNDLLLSQIHAYQDLDNWYSKRCDTLVLYDLSSPRNPVELGRPDTCSTAYAFEVWEGFRFGGAMLWDSLVIYALNHDAGSVGWPRIHVLGPLEIIAAKPSGERVFEISILDSVIEEYSDEDPDSSFTEYFSPRFLTRYESCLIADCGSWGVRFYDLSDIRNPALLSTIDIPYVNEMRVVHDRLVYTRVDSSNENDEQYWIGIFDISDPSQPVQLGEDLLRFWQAHYSPKLSISGDYAYFSTYGHDIFQPHLLIYDLVSLDMPEIEADISLPYEVQGRLGFDLCEDYLFAFVGADGVDLYSLADHLNPRYCNRLRFENWPPFEFKADNEFIYTIHSEEDENDSPYSINIFDFRQELSVRHPEATLDPTTLVLSPPYPNPLNSSTTISYTLLRAGWTTMDIVDITGRLVTRLSEGWKEAGSYREVWSPNLTSGSYIVTLRNGDQSNHRQIILQK